MPKSEPHALPRGPRLSPGQAALLLQAGLWVLLTGFYVAWYNRPNYQFGGSVASLVLLRLVYAVGLFNALVYLIIPRWLLRGRYGWVLAGAGALVIGHGLFNFYGYQLATAYLNPPPRLAHFYQVQVAPGLRQVVFSPMGLLDSLLALQVNMFFPIIISFVIYARVVARRQLALERDQLRLELHYLKAQINPRFLFTTLGTLQGLTRAHDARAPDVVLHLADLMRYTLYESDTVTVPLQRELDFLADYLALQRLHGRPGVSIQQACSGATGPWQVAPLALYPFLERLFAGLETTSGAHFSSEVHLTEQGLIATFHRYAPAAGLPLYATDAAVQIARRRLAMQYPGRHRVELRETATDVRVILHLDLRPDA